jgi:hypothetical protein
VCCLFFCYVLCVVWCVLHVLWRADFPLARLLVAAAFLALAFFLLFAAMFR